ncbi:hypothetical protein [Desulfurispira natronophila]|uniref:Outer membrane murein-binding lipoprotein Lpp n=1 Tax=Desulfurispira natronophila TaxID=682562 RepID=A0A7W7Y4F1_9BACT|nr:hypothetical protein [Desulfurispira natronophila]MBB5021890.1 outer membrane murein-binding lipoprotein Lpp [Desulfurispira natronophila]
MKNFGTTRLLLILLAALFTATVLLSGCGKPDPDLYPDQNNTGLQDDRDRALERLDRQVR